MGRSTHQLAAGLFPESFPAVIGGKPCAKSDLQSIDVALQRAHGLGVYPVQSLMQRDSRCAGHIAHTPDERVEFIVQPLYPCVLFPCPIANGEEGEAYRKEGYRCAGEQAELRGQQYRDDDSQRRESY